MYTQAGTEVFVSDVFGSALSATMTNANPCVVSFGSSTHGITDSGYVMLTSPWKRLNNKVFYVDVIDTHSFTLVGVDTSNTKLYPASDATASCKVIGDFTPIGYQMAFKANGGNVKEITGSYIDQLTDMKVPDGFEAITIDTEFDAEFVGTPIYTKLTNWSEAETVFAMRVVSRQGHFFTQAAKISLNKQLMFDKGKVTSCNAKLFPLAEANNYRAIA